MTPPLRLPIRSDTKLKNQLSRMTAVGEINAAISRRTAIAWCACLLAGVLAGWLICLLSLAGSFVAGRLKVGRRPRTERREMG